MASSLQLVPSDGADAAATFRQLGINFSIAEAVTDALVKARLQNLEEFRFFFESEDKVQPWLSKLSLGEDANLQGGFVGRVPPCRSISNNPNRIGLASRHLI